MRERKITDYKKLNHNIIVDTDILLTFDEEVRDDIDDSFLVKTVIYQSVEGIKSAIHKYEESELPNRFLEGQRFVVTNKLPSHIYGYFYLPNDDIVLDADAVSNIRRIESSFLFGHEMGHKIIRYRDTSSSQKEIARIFQMSVEGNEQNLKELYSDIIGLIASNFNSSEEDPKVTHLKRKVLSDLYRY